jgi:glutamate racemase
LSLIGVFDSGVGGLSILDEALHQLPQHNYLYLADSINAPYGEKSSHWIAQRSLVLCKYLADQGCDAIVVACNTATAQAIHEIRMKLSIPIIGVEPGIKPAAMQSQNGIVGVLATEATLNSDKFNALLATLPSDYRFIKQSGAGLVPLIEAGQADSPETVALLEKHLEPILTAGADTLVLGCTHYPFLKKIIHQLVGQRTTLVDTSHAVVKQLGRQLASLGQADPRVATGSVVLISTSDEARLMAMAKDLLSHDLSSHRIHSQFLGDIK